MDFAWIVEYVLIKECLIGIEDAGRLSCVSTKCRDLFAEDEFWQKQIEQLGIEDIVQPCIMKYYSSWKELAINYHILKNHYVKKHSIQFDGPVRPPKEFVLDEFLPIDEQPNMKSIVALHKVGDHDDGWEEAVFLMKDNTYFYYYESRSNYWSAEMHYMIRVTERALTLDALFYLAEEKLHQDCRQPSKPKCRLGFFTQRDMAKFIMERLQQEWNGMYEEVKLVRDKKYVNIYYRKKFHKRLKLTSLNPQHWKYLICSELEIRGKYMNTTEWLDKEGNPSPFMTMAYDQLPKITDVYVVAHFPPRNKRTKILSKTPPSGK